MSIDVVHRIVQLAQQGDPVMLPRATVFALCRCAMVLMGNKVALQEYSFSRFTAAQVRAADIALQSVVASASEIPTHIAALDDLRA